MAAGSSRPIVHSWRILAAFSRLASYGPDGPRAAVAPEVEHPEDERAEHRLGVLPADRLQGSPALGGEDRLVTDIALVAHADAPEGLHGLGGSRAAAKGGHGGVGRLGVPLLHRPDEFLFRLMRLGKAAFVDGPEHPIPLLDVLRLRSLEIIEGPEQGEQPLGHGRRLAQHVRRIDDHHGVELEADRPRLDVADARQEQARRAGPCTRGPS